MTFACLNCEKLAYAYACAGGCEEGKQKEGKKKKRDGDDRKGLTPSHK